MKKIYAILMALLPLIGTAQYTVEADHDTLKTAEVGDDVEFHHFVKNPTNDSLELKWRLFPTFTGVQDWEDYVCEGILLCFPASVRSHEFTVYSGDSVEIFHHVEALNLAGSGESQICFFDPTDSANTLNCVTVAVEAVMPDTLEVYVDGKAIYVIAGDSFEIYKGDYAALGLEDVVFNVELSQNTPNPFNETTTINYSLNANGGEIVIYDLTGKLIQKHILHAQTGKIRVGGDFQAGLYFYSLYSGGEHIDTKRMQVIN